MRGSEGYSPRPEAYDMTDLPNPPLAPPPQYPVPGPAVSAQALAALGAVARPQPPEPERPRVRLKVEPSPEGQLEQLLIGNKAAHDAAQAAKAAEDELKEAVKAWLLALFPDPADLPDSFVIAADPHGRYPGYTMTLKQGSHLDQEAMMADGVHEAVYGRYLVPNKASWDLREATGGKGRR
jgi:hypothetical protein